MRPVQKARIDFLQMAGGFVLLVIVGFLFYRQIIQAELYEGWNTESHFRQVVLRPERGEIISSDGVVLAHNTSVYYVGAAPREIRYLGAESKQDLALDIKRVMGIPDLQIDAQTLLTNYLVAHEDNTIDIQLDENFNWFYRESGEPVPEDAKKSDVLFFRVFRQSGFLYSDETAWLNAKIFRMRTFDVEQPWFELFERPIETQAAVQNLEDIYGVYITRAPFRVYPQQNTTSHLTGVVIHQDIQGASSDAEDMVGTIGLEEYYQDVLRGTAVEAVESISPFDDPIEERAVNGDTVRLTIDMAIQSAAEKALMEGIVEYEAIGGTVIVMDPQTGAILAMVNKPDFNPTDFSEIYESGEDSVLLNPAVSRRTPPGSVMKLLTAAMSLDAGVATPNWTYQDTVFFECAGHQVQNWDQEAHGLVDMEGMLAMSLNIGSSKLARAIGVDTFYEYMRAFRFDPEMTSKVDLANEGKPDVNFPGGPLWTEVDLCTNSFGQGFTVTPLQILSAVSTIGNKGVQMRPYMVAERVEADGEILVTEPQELGRPIGSEAANFINEMAANAVLREIGVAQLDGYTVAGKTSTSELTEDEFEDTYDTMGTFIGWFPHDNPEAIVLVNIERPQTTSFGSETAAPVFAKIAKEIVLTLNIPPDRVRTAELGQ